MVPPTAEFNGITGLDENLESSLSSFLQDKQHQLVRELQEAFAPLYGSQLEGASTIGQFLDLLKKCTTPAPNSMTLLDLQKKVDDALWAYVEILEKSVSELFSRLDEVGIGDWHQELASVVDHAATILQQEIKNTLDSIGRFEDQLWRVRDWMEAGAVRSVWVRKVRQLGRTLVDRQLFANLKTSLQTLEVRYLGWKNRFEDYAKYDLRTDEMAQQLASYELFGMLPSVSQDILQHIQRMLKIWEFDANAKAVLLLDICRALRNKVRFEDAYGVFREYYHLLKSRLFNISRDIKSSGVPLDLVAHLVEMQHEVDSLQKLVARYREFLLRTDPNPYVRSRWGFPEWVVGPEPENCRKLLKMEYQLETLHSLFGSLVTTLSTKSIEVDHTNAKHTSQEIVHLLRTLSQPLMSHHTFVADVDKLMSLAESYNELGNTQADSVPFIAEVLLRVLRYDAEHAVLFNNAVFHRVYGIHHEVAAVSLLDTAHNQALEALKQHITKVLKAARRSHDDKLIMHIDTLIEEVSKYLRELERLIKEQGQEVVPVVRERVLEISFLLGQFYHNLEKEAIQPAVIRESFAPLDKTLEQVERQLHDDHFGGF
ncbi:MAG: hypothetical protein Q8K75_11880 [Chlamydiales bacterium]|nr:hypothetical protein [Chlamydiales bacterium]